jgi:hypothetical protein
MSKTLQERLCDAKSVLDHVHDALGRHSGYVCIVVMIDDRKSRSCRPWLAGCV